MPKALQLCRAKVRFERIIRDAQNSICDAVTAIDGKPFHEDAWTREDGGGGISRVLQGGNVWEKAGVNVSVVYGSMPASAYRCAAAAQCGIRGTVQLCRNAAFRVR